MSESPTKPANAPAPVRNIIRSRMRAAPNVAVSSGMARNRRLSGHFQAAPEKTIQSATSTTTTTTADPSTTATSTAENQPTRSRSPSISQSSRSPSKLHNMSNDKLIENSDRETLLNTQFNAQVSSAVTALVQSTKPKSPAPHQMAAASVRMPFLSKINSPRVSLSSPEVTTIDSAGLPIDNNHSTSVNPASLSFRQYINYQSNVLQKQSTVNLVPLSPSVSMPPTPNLMPCTPGGTEYNPRFSNEHIMNIIKHKSLQKLKKIEAETLKEKRKSYQTTLNKEAILNGQLENTNSNDSAASCGPIDRSKTRMRDLLYYNSKKKTAETSNEIILNTSSNSPPGAGGSEISSSPDAASENSVEAELCETAKRKEQMLNSAPQLKFAEDGSIIINEESLIINREDEAPVFDGTVVEGEQIDNLTYISYRKFHHTKKWTERETAKFYKALGMIGTDFTMIQRLFNHRSRDEIKRKFKREEKLNQALIDKIMSKTSEIDLSVFVSASSEDEARKKKTSTKKKRTTSNTSNKEKSPDSEPKTKVLKRVQKRAFIDSESDEDTSATDRKAVNKRSTSQTLDTTTITTTTTTSPINPVKSTDPVVVNSDDGESDGEELVLDLDNNTITSQKTVINVNNYTESGEHQESEVNASESQDENIILDLDNNTILTNTEKMNLELLEQAPENAPSKSQIVITSILSKQA